MTQVSAQALRYRTGIVGLEKGLLTGAVLNFAFLGRRKYRLTSLEYGCYEN